MLERTFLDIRIFTLYFTREIVGSNFTRIKLVVTEDAKAFRFTKLRSRHRYRLSMKPSDQAWLLIEQCCLRNDQESERA